MSERPPCCVCWGDACLHGNRPHVFCYRHSEQRLLYPSAYIQLRPNATFTLWRRDAPEPVSDEEVSKMVEAHNRLPWYRHLFCLWC